jgi:rhomboid protease GluP
MSQPDDNPEDLQPVLRRFEQEFGQRREDEPQPIYGEARPIPQQTFRLNLPLRPARAVWVLLALNIAIFVIPALLQMAGVTINGVPINDYILLLGAKDNTAIKFQGEYYRLITAMFLHGGWLHIAVNAYALYLLGVQAERIYGTSRFLAVYFIAGLAGSIASYAFTPTDSVGASGAIFGLIGGLAAFYYLSRGLLGDISRQQLGSLITMAMINLFIGFSVAIVDNMAHIGGLMGGALAGWLLAPRFVLDERLYPPQIVRRSQPAAWAGALGMLALLVFLAMMINPPIR